MGKLKTAQKGNGQRRGSFRRLRPVLAVGAFAAALGAMPAHAQEFDNECRIESARRKIGQTLPREQAIPLFLELDKVERQIDGIEEKALIDHQKMKRDEMSGRGREQAPKKEGRHLLPFSLMFGTISFYLSLGISAIAGFAQIAKRKKANPGMCLAFSLVGAAAAVPVAWYLLPVSGLLGALTGVATAIAISGIGVIAGRNMMDALKREKPPS